MTTVISKSVCLTKKPRLRKYAGTAFILPVICLQGKLDFHLGLMAEVGGFLAMPAEIAVGAAKLGFCPLKSSQGAAQLRVPFTARMRADDGRGRRRGLGRSSGNAVESECGEGSKAKSKFS